jgi:hypothetical protein
MQVKMAEDMVARTAMSCGLGDLDLAPLLNSIKMCQESGMLTVTGLDLLGRDACFRGRTPISTSSELTSTKHCKPREPR